MSATRWTQSDYYSVLGIDRKADGEAVKQAYRQLAMRYHPDRNPGNQHAEEQFKRANAAYNVLSDPERRRAYDLYGHQRSDGATGVYDSFAGVGEFLEGVVGEVFRARRRRRVGRDIECSLEVTFEDAALGTKKTLTVPGSGRMPGDAVGSENFTVRVPPGVLDGSVRTIPKAGEMGPDGPGDLHVTVHVLPHPIFERHGADVTCAVPVSVAQACLGGHLDVPTLEGMVRIRLPAGTENGRVFRLRGLGIPVFGGYGRGDLLVRVCIEVPTALEDRQRRWLASLERSLTDTQLPERAAYRAALSELYPDDAYDADVG